MNHRRIAPIVVSVTAALGTAYATGSWRPTLHRAVLPGDGSAHLHVYGSHGASTTNTSPKFDSALAEIVRRAPGVRPAAQLADLHAINPAARFDADPQSGAAYVLVDAVTRGDPAALQAALDGLGLRHGARFGNDVSGWLPVASLRAATALGELHSIRAALPHRRATATPVAIGGQGDYAQGSQAARRADPNLTGAGITVGVLSDSFDCYSQYAANKTPTSGSQGYAPNGFTADAASDEASGALPSSVNVLAEAPCLQYDPIEPPFGDEGRAMLQIVHSVAPRASLAFYTAENGEADFASGIGKLASAGATVIADDVGYYDEPYFQDGLIAQAIDQVAAQGVSYFSAAGNNGAQAFDLLAPNVKFTTRSTSGPNAGEYLLNFTPANASPATTLPVAVPAIPPGVFLAVLLHWDQPYVTGTPAGSNSPGASSQLDLCISGTGSDLIFNGETNASTTACTGPNALGSDPVQILIFGNPATAAASTAAQTVEIQVGLANGTPAPGRIRITVDDDGFGSVIDPTVATNSPTLQGHPGAAGAFAVGAAFYYDTPACRTDLTAAQIEPFSALGGTVANGTPILFSTSGAPATPSRRQKPDAVGPDGANDTFLGFTLEDSGLSGGLFPNATASCQNQPAYPNFFGTSAATPHVAGLAALMRQANPGLSPGAIVETLHQSAQPMASPAPDASSGYGFVQAAAALALVPAAAPTLMISSDSVTLGSSATLTWSSVNVSSCTASGAWSGAQPTSGTKVLTPTATGTQTYTLSCSNAAGTSEKSTTLTVAAPPSSGGGGGAFDGLAGLALGALGLLRRRRGLRKH